MKGRRIFSAVFIFGFLLPSLNLGCARLKTPFSLGHSEPVPENALLIPAPNFNDPAFFIRWSGPIEERDKIRYLLDRVGKSDERFIRNGRVHDGKKARQWLLYKLFHWVRGVETAVDFVLHVASFSQATGKAYLVETPEGKMYPLGSVLKNELLALEAHLAKPRELPTPLPSQPTGVLVSQAHPSKPAAV